MNPKLISLLAMTVAGCAAGPAVDEVALVGPCHAEAIQTYVGQAATQQVGTAMLGASGARVLRWVAMGQLITMEYRAERLTVRLDAANRIASATCG